MPVEAKFVSHERPAVFDAGRIPSGDWHMWRDLSDGDKNIVVVRCLMDDMGAVVYKIIDPKKLAILDAYMEVATQIDNGEAETSFDNGVDVHLTGAEIEKKIAPGFRYERSFTDYDGELGRLVLQHRMPNGFIQHVN